MITKNKLNELWEMEIIEIQHPKVIKGLWYCWVSEPSIENAVQQFREKYGFIPPTVYWKQSPSGKRSVYIPVEKGKQ